MSDDILDNSWSTHRSSVKDSLVVICLTLALSAIPSIILGTERLYDASGTLTFLVACIFSLLRPCFGNTVEMLGVSVGACAHGIAYDKRQAILTSIVALWALRLGLFLFIRILREGKDSRFDGIRDSPLKFTVAWVGQMFWVSCCAMPMIYLNSVRAGILAGFPRLSVLELLGLIMASTGLAVEVTADWQKSMWRKEKRERKHEEAFISRGLFSRSRYPHYFGDIMFWFGVATVVFGALWPEQVISALDFPSKNVGRLTVIGLTYISPVFAYIILTKISGIPLSEAKYDRAYGHREDYRAWRYATPRLLPKML